MNWTDYAQAGKSHPDAEVREFAETYESYMKELVSDFTAGRRTLELDESSYETAQRTLDNTRESIQKMELPAKYYYSMLWKIAEWQMLKQGLKMEKRKMSIKNDGIELNSIAPGDLNQEVATRFYNSRLPKEGLGEAGEDLQQETQSEAK